MKALALDPPGDVESHRPLELSFEHSRGLRASVDIEPELTDTKQGDIPVAAGLTRLGDPDNANIQMTEKGWEIKEASPNGRSGEVCHHAERIRLTGKVPRLHSNRHSVENDHTGKTLPSPWNGGSVYGFELNRIPRRQVNSKGRRI